MRHAATNDSFPPLFTYRADFYLKWPFVACNGCIVDTGKISAPRSIASRGVPTCALAKYGN